MVTVAAPTVWGLMAGRAAATPNALFLVDERDQALTFAAYVRAAERAAGGLVALGIEPGSTVAWQMPTWIETVTLLGGAVTHQARQVPLLPIWRESELRFCLDQSRARALIVPGVWRGYDYSALATRVTEPGAGLSVLVCDRVLPDGDPSTLGREPGSGEQHSWILLLVRDCGAPEGRLAQR